MNEPHYGHAGTVYGGYMYISGTTHTPAIFFLYLPFNQPDRNMEIFLFKCENCIPLVAPNAMSNWVGCSENKMAKLFSSAIHPGMGEIIFT